MTGEKVATIGRLENRKLMLIQKGTGSARRSRLLLLEAVRTPRIKIVPEEGEAVYHCLSRTVNGEWLFDDASKEVLRKHLWQVADFCGVKIVTYAIVSNHFHIFVRIPKKTPIADAELLRRYRVLHPHPNRYQAARLAVIEHWLATNAPEGEIWRQRIQKLREMFPLS